MSVHYVDDFMLAALHEAERALVEGEVPVGCVLVKRHDNEDRYERLRDGLHTTSEKAPPNPSEIACIAARGRNQTNRLRHAMAHAEYVAVESLMHSPSTTQDACRTGDGETENSNGIADLSSYVLYVTVEPCVMCGGMLLLNQIGHVFFGCRNPRFGGNGTVLALHKPPTSVQTTSGPLGEVVEKVGACDSPPPQQKAKLEAPACADAERAACDTASLSGSPPSAQVANTSAEQVRDAGVSWWPGYSSEGGHREGEAIAMLQRFYERENPNAPGHKRRLKSKA